MSRAVYFNENTRRCVPESYRLRTRRRQNLKSVKMISFLRLKPSTPLLFHDSLFKVSQNTFVQLAGTGEFEIELLSGAF
jgi:hypothetical protein